MTLKLIALRLVGSLQTSSQLGAPLPRLLQRDYENISCANICNRHERETKKGKWGQALEGGLETELNEREKKDVDPPGCARTNLGVCFTQTEIKQKEKKV